MAWWAALAGQGAAQLGKLDTALTAQAFAGWSDRRQLRQQGKLQAQAIEGQKELADYDQQLAYDMWEKTNYDAQRKQMEKAGLNVGLMYGGGGAGGGSTAGAGKADGISMASAPAGGRELEIFANMATQAKMQQAQIELLRAQTKKTEVEAEKTAGVDTEKAGAEINQINAKTKSETLNAEIQSWNKIVAENEANISTETKDSNVEIIKNTAAKLDGEARSALTKSYIDQETYDEIIKQTKQTTTEQQLRMEMQKAGIKNTEADTAAKKQGIDLMVQEIVNMRDDIRARWRSWEQSEKERWVKEAKLKVEQAGGEFMYGEDAQDLRWIKVITDTINGITK